MLLINNYDRDADNTAYVQECMAQRERLNVTVSEEDGLTVDELEQTLDYEDDMLDREFWAKGSW